MAADTLPAVLEQLLQRIDGLQGVVVSDRDGVVVAKAGSALPVTVETALVASFSASSDQASKLSIGKNKLILTAFAGHNVVQFNHAPLLVTLVAAKGANLGVLVDSGKDLHAILQPAAAVIQELSFAGGAK